MIPTAGNSGLALMIRKLSIMRSGKPELFLDSSMTSQIS